MVIPEPRVVLFDAQFRVAFDVPFLASSVFTFPYALEELFVVTSMGQFCPDVCVHFRAHFRSKLRNQSCAKKWTGGNLGKR